MSILLVIAASSIALAAEDPVATSSDWNKVCVFTFMFFLLKNKDLFKVKASDFELREWVVHGII